MFGRYTSTFFALATLVCCAGALPLAAQSPGSLTGQITDETGASIPAATVSVLKAGAIVSTVQTNEQGIFNIANISAGSYSLRVEHTGFNAVETKLPLRAGQKTTFNTQLKLAANTQSVTVQGEAVGTVSVDASQNASALVLKQTEIDALPDDPDDLATDLQQLAGPSAGPSGGQIYIDGFTGGRLPPKESIREIRINQNPYSAEYDKLGYGRIEILTKPGTDKLHGQAFFNDSDGVFNARNPFLTEHPDFSSRQFGGNLAGSINKKTSFFFDVERRNIDDNGIIVANVLDPNTLVPTALNSFTPAPQRRTEFSPRVDYQLNSTNTLVVKYNFERNTVDNSGVGQFNLASQGSNTIGYEHSLQATETAILSPKAINETRFRWLRTLDDSTAVQPGTTIRVSSSFVSGGSSTASTSSDETGYELQNYTTVTQGIQAIKFGLRIRSSQYSQNSPSNFLGTFTFAGGVGETSIEQYQKTLLLEQQGLSFSQIRALGGGASQFSIAGGNPRASIAQLDAGLFVQDDIRLRPNLTVNFGLRYEIQNQIGDFHDFAPRFGFAWSPDGRGGKQGKTVIRGGAGFFYDRLQYMYSLNGLIYNGQTIQNYVVSNPNFFSTVPPISTFTANAVPQTIDQVDKNLRAPYTIQTAIGIERALPRNTTVAFNYINSLGLHQFRTVNINAPNPALGNARPLGDALGNVYNYESDGIFRQNQLIFTVNTRVTPAVSLFSFYTLGWAKSNTDGIGTYPANQYDFSNEYSRAQFDSRNRLFLGGSVTARWGIRLSPFLFYQSGRPFNITSGDDYLNTSLFNERPSFTTLPCTATGVACTAYGKFDLNPQPGETIIPRNYGNGPSLFALNMRLSKTFGFGERSSSGPSDFNRGGGGGGGGGRGGPGGGGPPGMGRGMGGIFGDASTGKKYNLTFTAQARNILNTVNDANPIGVLTSPLFGQSTQLAVGGPGGSNTNNRRLEFGLRFAF